MLSLSFTQQSLSEWQKIAIEKLTLPRLASWERSLWQFVADWYSPATTIELHTSGSTGAPKTIMVNKEMMRLSAQKTLDFFKLKPGDTALLCLSIDYIAGKMMVVRAIEGGLRLLAVEPNSEPLNNISQEIDFAAMVPMQVFEVMKTDKPLNRVKTLLIGGGAVSSKLQAALQSVECTCYESYGMTETVSHIALRKINGKNRQDFFIPMKGIEVSVDKRDCLTISEPGFLSQTLHSNDIVELLPDHRFRIRGRIDNVINSGGIKIQPEEIEAQIASFFTHPYAVTSLPDERLGERLVLVAEELVSPEQLDVINALLPTYHRIHAVYYLADLSKTPNGKLDRKGIRATL
ncbi:MAG: AMP-binding protein [Prevotellaceae bacterium]|jgi:O-succinylbenzoic acid--CoA ligase|nr:AMP-binding protein [Prevotellaceae bacterium]